MTEVSRNGSIRVKHEYFLSREGMNVSNLKRTSKPQKNFKPKGAFLASRRTVRRQAVNNSQRLHPAESVILGEKATIWQGHPLARRMPTSRREELL